MANNKYLGITEASGSRTGEEHFFFSLKSDPKTLGFPAEAIDMVWDRFLRPSQLVRVTHPVPPSGVAFNAVRIERHIRDEECKRIKASILDAKPELHSFDIYVFKEGLHFWILKLTGVDFNVLSCLPEYSRCRQYRYRVESIPVISQSHIMYGMTVTKFRENLEKEKNSV